MGMPMIPITATQIRMVTEAHSKDPAGVVRIAKRLRHDTYRAVCRIMKKNGTAASSYEFTSSGILCTNHIN